MAALLLMEFLRRHQLATDAERKAIDDALEADAWSGYELFFAGGEAPPDPEGDRKRSLRARAEAALAAILERVLAHTRPTATALDETLRRVDFGLDGLLDDGNGDDNVRFVHWPTSTLNRPLRGHLAALYRAAIEVEVPATDQPIGPVQAHTGAPGRPPPTSMYLVKQEFENRARAQPSQLAETLAEQARQLRQWALDNHRDRPAPTEKTIKNALREAYKLKGPK